MGLLLISKVEGLLVGLLELSSVVSMSIVSICFSRAFSSPGVVFGSFAASLSSECWGV